MINGTVLYVEDEEFDVFFMQRAFEQAGLNGSLKVVITGKDAIDYLRGDGVYADRERHPLPSIILLDLNLPLISGFQVLEWLRSESQFQHLPVIVFSSSARPEDKTRANKLGAKDYIQKPGSGLEFSVIVQTLKERWLDREHGKLPSQQGESFRLSPRPN